MPVLLAPFKSVRPGRIAPIVPVEFALLQCALGVVAL